MTQVQPTLVVTPEAVPLEFEVGGIGSRFLALVIDWTAQAAALGAVLAAAGLLAQSPVGDHGIGAALAYLLSFFVIFGYPVAMETLWRGRTLGKAALGLRVLTKEGAPVRFRHAAIRAALGLVDFALSGGAAAVLSVLLTRDNQRLGDLVAGTLVLRERTGLPKPAPVRFSVPPGLEGYAATLDVTGLRPRDYAAVRAFLLRAPSLPPRVRADLAVQLARPLGERLRTTPPPELSAELFLLCLAGRYQAQGSYPGTPPGTPSPPPAPSPPPPPPPAPPHDDSGFVPPA